MKKAPAIGLAWDGGITTGCPTKRLAPLDKQYQCVPAREKDVRIIGRKSGGVVFRRGEAYSPEYAMTDTVQLFIVAAGWTIISVLIARLVPNWPGRLALFAVLVGTPFWELPFGYFNFLRICNEQARLIIFEKISPQDSVCVDDLDAGLYAYLSQAGFSRIEVKGRSDDPDRYIASGRVVFAKLPEIRSQYCIGYENNVSLPYRILRGDILVQHAKDNHIVAKQSRIFWSGMWWQEMARPILGRGGVCFADPRGPIAAIRNGAG